MLAKLTNLFQRTFPAPLDNGVFTERPPAIEMDLSSQVLGGWLEKINRYALEASRQKNAYQVDDDGFLFYDAFLRQRIIEQFRPLNIDVTRWEINAILLDANGASDACTQIAAACHKIQVSRTQNKQATTP